MWPKLSEAQHAEVMRFGDDFKQFIGRAKTEMTFVARGDAAARGATGSSRGRHRRPRRMSARVARWYAVNRDRTIVAFVVGSEPLDRRRAHRQHAQRFGAARAQAEAVPRQLRHLAARHDDPRRAEELSVGQSAAGAHRTGDPDRRDERRRSTSARTRPIRCCSSPTSRRTSISDFLERRNRDVIADRGARSDSRADARRGDEGDQGQIQADAGGFPVGRSADRPGADAGGRRPRPAAGRRLRPRRPVERLCGVPRDRRSAHAREDRHRLRRQQRGSRARGRPASIPSGFGRCWPR